MKPEVLAAKGRGYMQGAQKREEAGNYLSASEYYFKAAEYYLEACKSTDSSRHIPLWKNYTSFLIKKAKSLKHHTTQQQVQSQDEDRERRAEAEELIVAESPDVRFENVVGLSDVKERIKESVIHPIAHPEMYEQLNVTPPKGILFYGPPGCGKTFLAKAAATEGNATFISLDVSDVMDKYVGESEKKVREVFELAREKQRAIVFIDEIDAVATSRDQSSEGYERRLVNELLSQMDGVSTGDDGILVLAATNRPWEIDRALLRGKRFTDSVFIPHPDFDARKALFQLQLESTPTTEVDYDELAEASLGFEAARIADACNEAGLQVIRSNLKDESSEEKLKITMDDLRNALASKRADLILPGWYSDALRELRERGQSEQFQDFVQAAHDLLGDSAEEGVS